MPPRRDTRRGGLHRQQLVEVVVGLVRELAHDRAHGETAGPTASDPGMTTGGQRPGVAASALESIRRTGEGRAPTAATTPVRTRASAVQAKPRTPCASRQPGRI